MPKSHAISIVPCVASLVLHMGFTSLAVADCAGVSVKDTKRAYERAQGYEKQGRTEQALRLYRGAEDHVCEGSNPYAANAAKRAAALGLALGGAAQKAGDFSKAAEMYDAGGHYALADRAFMELTRAKQDEPSAFQQARQRFDARALSAFQRNNAAALAVTGAYSPDPKLIEEVKALPARGIERASRKETAAFNETFLREYVQLIQSRPDDLTDPSALQRTISAQQAFAQKWPQDFMKSSREALQLMRMWGLNGGDEALENSTQAQIAQRADQHARVIMQKYSGAPELLEAARDFIRLMGLEPANEGERLAAVQALALKLAAEANARRRYTLAGDYYDVAGQSEKAQAVRTKQSQLAGT